jgi:hypothetical protein
MPAPVLHGNAVIAGAAPDRRPVFARRKADRHDQLSPQLPGAGAASTRAGQQLTTGAQAEVYADHFIANHLKAIGGGKTYAQLSAEAIAQPNNAKLAAQVATVFKGETLRGLLLNAYAFGTMGMIAGIARSPPSSPRSSC